MAFAIPLFSLAYMIFYPFLRLGIRLPMLDGEWMLGLCLVFALCGFVAGILAPPKMRLATALAGIIIILLVLAIPRGVL